MLKKILLLLSVCVFSFHVLATDDFATGLMLINNYDLRQNDDIWGRIRAGFQLDHEETSKVKYFERMYSRNPRRFEAMMATAAPYLYYLLTEIERRGMPTELVFIPGIESTFNPLVTRPDDSYAGMWQFVPMTGRRFNMTQNSNIDERRDIIKSSRAALNYLNYLHNIFLQWDVSIGAYNWGEGGMYRAILDSGQKIGSVKYADLNVRQITLDYEPKMIALANIIANPSKFGVTLQNEPNHPYFAIVHPQTETILADVAKTSQADSGTFHKLNGQYKSADYQLLPQNHVILPLPNQTIYYASLGITPAVSVPNINNTLEIANNQAAIASEIPEEHMDPSILLSDGSPTSYSGETKAEAKASAEQAVTLDAIDVAAHAGDNATTIAANNTNNVAGSATNPSVENPVIVASNDSSQVAPQEDNHTVDDLIDQVDSTTNTVQKVTSPYTVVAGDTLYSIARKLKISVTKIKHMNKIPGNNLAVGQTLVVPGSN